jgi:hypothetical protein
MAKLVGGIVHTVGVLICSVWLVWLCLFIAVAVVANFFLPKVLNSNKCKVFVGFVLVVHSELVCSEEFFEWVGDHRMV